MTSAAPPLPPACHAADAPPELRHFGWVVLLPGAPPQVLLRYQAPTRREAAQRARELGGEIVAVYRWAQDAGRAPCAGCAQCAPCNAPPPGRAAGPRAD